MSENKLDESKSNIEMGSLIKDGSGNKTGNGTPSTSLKKKDKGQKDDFEVIKPPEKNASNPQNSSSNTIGGPQWKKTIFNVLNHNYVVVFMTLVTVWALISDDTRVLVTNKNGDAVFYILTAICFALFALEVILGAIVKPDYFMSFFFFLDVLSTITLALDIGWVMDALTGTDSSSSGPSGGSSKNTQKQAQLAKAGKASRVGARAARIVRIVRLIRLIRVVKLYKHAQQVMNEKKLDDEDESIYPVDGSRPAIESGAIGAQRNESANQRAIEAAANGIVLPGPEISGSANGLKIHPAISSSGNKLGEIDPQKKDGVEQPADPNAQGATNGQVAPTDGQPINRSMTIAQSGQVNQSSANVEDEVPKESNVSKKLSDLTIRRVIVLVLAIMISIPVFSADTWTSTDTSYNAGLQIVYSYIQNNDTTSTNFLISLNTYINEHATIRDPLVMFSMNIPYLTSTTANLSYTFYSVANVGNVDFTTDSSGNASLYFPGSNAANYSSTYLTIPDVSTFRSADLNTVTAQDNSGNTVGYAQFDTSADSFMNAWLGLIRTVFVCLVLTVGAVLFTQDATDLVLTPIEEMLKKVKRIAANPIEAVQIDEQEAYERELIEQQLATSGKTDEMKEKDKSKTKKVNYETEILEKLISKIGALLALGFGEAGSEIIAKNMAGAGEVDPMIPGKKIQAIFGFCDIRNFTDATEVLQEGVMVFVNEIAEIVHSTVDRFCGSANKNIGDAFLLVWKFPEELIEDDPEKPGECRLKKIKQVNMFSDLALIAFLKIIGRINSSPKLEKYKHNPGLNARLPNYSVKMGFGLHCGWAIEGAIGSDFKIDASYLSPNVNMASRLEAATKQFGVPILVSGPLRNIMTEEVHREMRHIDRVTVKGSVDPVDFYTVDLDFHKLGINHKEPDLSQMPKKERKLRKLNARKKRNELKKNIVDGKKKISDMFKTDKELVLMRSSFPSSFKAEFEQGLQHYLDGKWDQARTVFEKTLNMIPNHKDGPSQTLLDVIIHENGGKCPSDWEGFRPLTEK